MSSIRVPLQDFQQRFSEARIPTGELEGKGWEYHLKIVAFLEVPRTEETSPKLSNRSGGLGE